MYLRILPLGASIVYGTDSSDGNGFRNSLREQIIANNGAVNYVGELQAGNMLDNDVEGVSENTWALPLLLLDLRKCCWSSTDCLHSGLAIELTKLQSKRRTLFRGW